MTNTTPPTPNLLALYTDPNYKHHRVVPMMQYVEGKELYLPMVLLTSRESRQLEQDVYQATLKDFHGKAPKQDEPMQSWDNAMEAFRAYYTIWMSIRQPNDLKKRWFESLEDVMDKYNDDTCGIMMSHYMTVRLSQPHLKHLDPNDPSSFQNMIDNIRKMGEQSDFFLNGFTSHSVNQLLKYLVNQLATSPTHTGSSGSP